MFIMSNVLSLNIMNAKHIIEEIKGTRASLIETGIDEKRMLFLSELLYINKYEVLIEELPKTDENSPKTYKIGVSDLLFNPALKIYQRSLRTSDNQILTIDYWYQKTKVCNPVYW